MLLAFVPPQTISLWFPLLSRLRVTQKRKPPVQRVARGQDVAHSRPSLRSFKSVVKACLKFLAKGDVRGVQKVKSELLQVRFECDGKK